MSCIDQVDNKDVLLISEQQQLWLPQSQFPYLDQLNGELTCSQIIAEQREEENLIRGILDKIKLIGTGPMSLYYIDKEIQKINAAELKAAAAGDSVTVKAATGLPTSVPVVAEADLYFPEEGTTSALGNILGGTVVSVDTPIELTTSADFTASLDPSAGACRNSPSALLVEVCYYRAAPAPDIEDAHVPYAIEAGQGY